MLIAIDRVVIKHSSYKAFCRSSIVVKRGIATTSNTPPVLRFAPSPTGQLHLGGLRTALFNHLFARSLGGRWILRIEDTDRKRLVPDAIESMQDILRWAGLHYDEGPDKPGNRGPYIQSERLNIYKHYSEKLIQSGQAYRDFRGSSQDVSSEFGPEGYLSPNEEEAKQMIRDGKSYVVRFKTGECNSSFHDAVYGHVNIPYDRQSEDPIIIKSDGWPTYHLANIVDDMEMGITHVFRGEEWLPSMPIHLGLYRAIGASPPQFVHLPLLINPDGSKLSKRHADVHVESYRAAGYEPEALINFVALMGFNWHLSDSRNEVFHLEEMIAEFKLDRIAKSRACPDVSKLRFLNKSHFAAKIDRADKKEKQIILSELAEQIKRKDPNFPFFHLFAEERGFVILDAIVKRSTNMGEAADEIRELYSTVNYTKDAVEEMEKFDAKTKGIALSLAQTYFSQVKDQTHFQSDRLASSSLKELVKRFEKQVKEELPKSDKQNRTRATFFKIIRMALTGKVAGPTLVEIILLLGKEECIARMKRAIDWLVHQ